MALARETRQRMAYGVWQLAGNIFFWQPASLCGAVYNAANGLQLALAALALA
jgi:hypothetical protein